MFFRFFFENLQPRHSWDSCDSCSKNAVISVCYFSAFCPSFRQNAKISNKFSIFTFQFSTIFRTFALAFSRISIKLLNQTHKNYAQR
jgi:hypothetical protein